jgi:hypothetical protein
MADIMVGKKQIRTPLQSEKGSDFVVLVEISGIEPLTS